MLRSRASLGASVEADHIARDEFEIFESDQGLAFRCLGALALQQRDASSPARR